MGEIDTFFIMKHEIGDCKRIDLENILNFWFGE